MAGAWTHICPKCGRFFAAYTPGQVVLLLVVSVVTSFVLCIGLVIALWFLV